MHDFNCTDADDMHYALMAERTRYLKENPEGVRIMCKAMEDMRTETVLELLFSLVKKGLLTVKDAALFTPEKEFMK